MSHVFISHAAQDRKIAARVREGLTQAGIETWMDSDLKPGDPLEEKIREALHNAQSIVILLSPAAANSPEVGREYKTILAQNKRLYVALVAPIASQDIPLRLQIIQHINLTQDFEAGMSHLIEALQTENPSTYSSQNESPDYLTSRRRASVKLEVDLNDLDDSKRKSLVDLVTKLTEAGVEEIRVVDVNVG